MAEPTYRRGVASSAVDFVKGQKEAAIDRGIERKKSVLDVADKRLRLQDLQDEVQINPRKRRAELRRTVADAKKAETLADIEEGTYAAQVYKKHHEEREAYWKSQTEQAEAENRADKLRSEINLNGRMPA